MKPYFLLVALVLIGCASPQVGPKPDTAPVSTSNAATRASITQSQAKIQQSRDQYRQAKIHGAKGATALEKADDLISQMLK
jgi:hypothetical protein